MIPKYAFEVRVQRKRGDIVDYQTKPFESIGPAVAYRDSILKAPNTVKVTLYTILDETTVAEARTAAAFLKTC